MSGPYVATKAIREAVRGRETEVLDALGVRWRDGRPHIRCPYPEHDDGDPSWRWDARRAHAYCTCLLRPDSVFDVVMKVRGVDFEAAKLFIAETIGRHDLIKTGAADGGKGKRGPGFSAKSLLRPNAAERDDGLVHAYLAHRLGVAPAEVPMPTTPVVGWRALPYYDPPPNGGRRPELVGHFPCAVFGTVDGDGRGHAHRIYVAPGGAGKAELGAGPDGRPRDPKKSAKVTGDENTAGRSVLWGDPAAAPHLVLCEGIETAAAVALAFKPEIEAGSVAVAAAIGTAGVEAFRPYPATGRVTVAADRDEAPEKRGRAGYRRGERAARAFGLRHHERLVVAIALPGASGEKADWLDVLRRDGAEAVRAGIEAAAAFEPTVEEAEEESARRERPVIRVRGGSLAENTRAAIDALRQADVGIYDRGGKLYRVVELEADERRGGIKRCRGLLVLVEVAPEWVELRLADRSIWEKFDARSETWRRIDPPSKIAGHIVAVPDEVPWPYLRGIVRHPVLLPNGRVVARDGYDPETRLLLELAGTEWPKVPERPTKADAVAARERLEKLTRHFDWASTTDKAVALSLFLTTMVRPLLPTAPLHAIDAPLPGSGKSLLIDAAAILATGEKASVMDYGADPIEAAKRLDTMLLAGDTFIALDNIEAPLEGSALCQTLTSERREVRVLGSSTKVKVSCTAMLTATGNNLAVHRDMVRRTLVCRIEPKTERPELREIEQDLLAEVRERRGELVRDCHTIMRAYIQASPDGRRARPLTGLGSFEDWSRIVREALVWAGSADPVGKIEETREADPTRQAVQAVLVAWREAFQGEAKTAAEACRVAESHEELREALGEVARRSGGLDSTALGYWLRQNHGARAGNLLLRKAGTTRTKTQRWEVAELSGEPDQPAPNGPLNGAGDAGDAGDVSAPRAKSVRSQNCVSARESKAGRATGDRQSGDVTNRVRAMAGSPASPASPAPNGADRCAWCHEPGRPGAGLLPVGTADEGHAWLHAACRHAVRAEGLGHADLLERAALADEGRP